MVIRCKNEERWIGHTIQSIFDHLGKAEIVVIDNGSEDQSRDIVKSFTHDPKLDNKKNDNFTNIKLIHINNYSPGKSLNLGVKKSTKKYVLIISAHCVLKKFSTTEVIKNLEKYSAIFGKQNPIYRGKKIKKRYIWSHFTDKKMSNMFSKMEDRYFFHNAFSIFKRSTLLKNPFDIHLTSKEDRYWINDLVKNKKKHFLYDPSLEVDHHYTDHGNTWKGIG